MSLADLRREYQGAPLSEVESDPDPFRQFACWMQEARATEPDPTAMALATATRTGEPSVRKVLLKGADERGFVFYTNYDSRKAHDIADTGRAALLFFWHGLDRQVRITGAVEKVSDAESDAYFATRPVESRLSVYASHQSAAIESRAALESEFEGARLAYGASVPRPAWWGGYRVVPAEFEFWQGRPNRLHDRVRYARDASGWTRARLAP
jgi:pyridoxamine 5'-phosphate oxidase